MLTAVDQAANHTAHQQLTRHAGNQSLGKPFAGKECNSIFNPECIMSDDKSKVGSPDRDRINVNENYEVRYWSEKFGVSAEKLKAAVSAVGPTAKAVEAHLKGRN